MSAGGGRGERKKLLGRLQAQCGAHYRSWSHDPGIMTRAKIKTRMLTDLPTQVPNTVLILKRKREREHKLLT